MLTQAPQMSRRLRPLRPRHDQRVCYCCGCIGRPLYAPLTGDAVTKLLVRAIAGECQLCNILARQIASADDNYPGTAPSPCGYSGRLLSFRPAMRPLRSCDVLQPPPTRPASFHIQALWPVWLNSLPSAEFCQCRDERLDTAIRSTLTDQSSWRSYHKRARRA